MEQINETIDKYIKEKDSKNKKMISTGFPDLDRAINGLSGNNLILIASRPAMGKSNLLLSIATNVAMNEKIPVAYFNLEMSKERCVKKIISANAMVKVDSIEHVEIEEYEWENICKVSKELSKAKLFIDDTPAVSLTDIFSACKKLKEKQGLGLILVDYMQLISTAQDIGNEHRNAVICSRLKGMANLLKVPIIVTSQLSRKPEEREDKRPRITDFACPPKDLDDADAIILLYRDDYYKKHKKYKKIMELIIAKNQLGDIGTIELACLDEYAKVINIDNKKEQK